MAVEHRLHCLHVNSAWVHLPALRDVNLSVSLGVSK